MPELQSPAKNPPKIGNPAFGKTITRKGHKPPDTPRRQLVLLQRQIGKDALDPKTSPALRVDLVRSWLAIQDEIKALTPSRGGSSMPNPSPKASAFVPPVETSDNVPPIEPDNPEV